LASELRSELTGKEQNWDVGVPLGFSGLDDIIIDHFHICSRASTLGEVKP